MLLHKLMSHFIMFGGALSKAISYNGKSLFVRPDYLWKKHIYRVPDNRYDALPFELIRQMYHFFMHFE